MVGWIAPLISGVASLAGGALSANASKKAAQTASQGSEQELALARDMYAQQMALLQPSYRIGGDATNKLARIYGLRPQNFDAAWKQSQNGLAPFGNPVASQYGAGGSGTKRPSTSTLWNKDNPSVGRFDLAANLFGKEFADPVSSTILQKTGFDINDPLSLVMNNKPRATNAYDIWDTPENNAKDAGALDYQGIYDSRPDFQSYLKELPTRDARGYDMMRKSYDLDGSGEIEGGEMAQWWLANTDDGKKFDTSPWTREARSEAGGGSTANGSSTGTNLPTGSGVNLEWGSGSQMVEGGGIGGNSFSDTDPMDEFWSSPDGRLASAGFLDVDTPEVRGGFASAGKGISGASQKALYDRGRNRAQGAFASYTNGLRSLAGLEQSGVQNITNAGNTFAGTAGNAYQSMANNRASGYAGQVQGWTNGLAGAAGAFDDYAKKRGWS